MKAFAVKAQTAVALGWRSIARVLSYRFSVKLGINPVRRLQAAPVQGAFFSSAESCQLEWTARSSGYDRLEAFGSTIQQELTRPPDWFSNVLGGCSVPAPDRKWWRIPDFDVAVGDIKGVWELSRFDWLIAAAQHAAQGEATALDRMNDWLQDWCDRNPPYAGPNWKCGQEASIRVLHLLLSALLLQQQGCPLGGLMRLIEVHLKRIRPTIHYAVGQDNNHGISEAAALFAGGAWLAANHVSEGSRWYKIGRRWLEDRVSNLIQPDGSFSQYSLNYHRMMLDTLYFVEIMRRQLNLPAFSSQYMQRARSAVQWLHSLVDPLTGDGPNLGANDGAHILKLSDADYRDHRPSVQQASILFLGRRAYAAGGSFDNGLSWMGLQSPTDSFATLRSRMSDDGGFAVLRRESVMAMLRYPRFRFRPSQADLLHVDLWIRGKNLLRDAGTYSYNTSDNWMSYFAGTQGHNTVQFDGRDQMPRLSRFLFGAWPKTEKFYPIAEDNGVQTVGASYRDWLGATHFRKVVLENYTMRVLDEIGGFKHRAVLRWRLIPGPWSLEERAVATGHQWELFGPYGFRIVLTSNVLVCRCELVEGWESRYYGQKTPLPVIELEVSEAAELATQVEWQQ